MGNAHVFRHRIPAIGAASLVTVAVVLLTVAGTTCSFLNVEARRGELVEVTQEQGLQVYLNSLSIGILCEGDYYSSEGDTMWEVSRIFWIISVILGYIICVLAWAICFVVPPSDSNWKLLSVLSALTAVIQLPIFLMFEVDACSEFSSRQECKVSLGSYLLISSTILWIANTVLTQFMDPPRWAIELNAWKVRNGDATEPSLPRHERLVLSDEYNQDDNRSRPVGVIGGLREWNRKRRQREPIGMKATESASRDEEEGEAFGESQSYYADSNNSRLLLKVLPNGKRPGDDQNSAASFGDLDDFSMQSSQPSSPAARAADDSLLGEELVDEEDPKLLEDDRQAGVVDDSLASVSPETNDLESGLEGEMNDLRPENADSAGAAQGQGVLLLGMRALTSRIKRETPHKTKNGKAYAVVEDEGSRSSHYTPPSTQLLAPGVLTKGAVSNKDTLAPDTKDDESLLSDMDESEAVSSLASSERRAREVLTKDWNALHAAAIEAAPISYDGSSSEDEPEPVYYSSDETISLVSLSSLVPENESESSSLSSSSYSDSSDGEGGRRRGRRSRRRRTFSCGDSVSSRTSVIEYTINEETEVDLKEFEKEDSPGQGPYPMQRTQSAPHSHRSMRGPYDLSHVDSMPTVLGRKSMIRSIDETADMSGSSSVLRLASVPVTVEIHEADMEPLLSGDDTSRTGGGYKSDPHILEGYTPSADEESGIHRRGRSLSVPRRALFGMSYADDPSVASLPTPWHDERIYKAGIHSDINFVSDGSSDTDSARTGRSNVSRVARRARMNRLQREVGSPEQRRRARTLDPPRARRHGKRRSSSVVLVDSPDSDSRSALTGRSNLSRRARHARIQRLQRETETSEQRRRSRTLDPPRKRTTMSARIHNVISPSLNLILVERASGVDYGPDEASL